jgi:hypothetical protein
VYERGHENRGGREAVAGSRVAAEAWGMASSFWSLASANLRSQIPLRAAQGGPEIDALRAARWRPRQSKQSPGSDRHSARDSRSHTPVKTDQGSENGNLRCV